MWLCGHFHLDRTVGNVRFLYDDIYEIKLKRRHYGAYAL